MNTWQVCRQLKYLLRSRTWDGTTNAFGSVHVTAAPKEAAYGVFRFPLALIRPLSARFDPDFGEEPELVMQDVEVQLVVANAADVVGEASLIGANRAAVPTTSAGRGLLEVEEALMDAAARLSAIDGVEMLCRARSAVGAVHDDAIGYAAFRTYTFEVMTTADRFYHPATRLSATAAGGGSVSLTWRLPPDRYDRRRVVLRRASGSTAPASITAGTGVTLSGDLATSVTDAPGAGTFSYSVFATYDETDGRPEGTPDSDDFVSAAETDTVTAT